MVTHKESTKFNTHKIGATNMTAYTIKMNCVFSHYYQCPRKNTHKKPYTAEQLVSSFIISRGEKMSVS